MGTLAQDDLQQYANVVNGTQSFPPSANMKILFTSQYEGKVYSKGRPRFSSSGRAYTPATTRKFEKVLVEYFIKRRDGIIMCPMHIKLIVYDKIPKAFTKLERQLAMHRFIFSATGDLADNKVKSILDAGNGVLYADDSQISSVNYNRLYHDFEGFYLEIRRAGLSPAEAHNVGNLL